MLQEFHQLTLRGISPGLSAVPSSLRSLNSSRQSLHSVPTRSASRQESPSSAAALSSSVTQPISQSTYVDKRPSYPNHLSSISSQGPRRPRHSLFYMRDEMVTFNVEECLYRVHRHHLERDSEYFRRLFLSRSVEDGRADETAITLPGVLQHEFDCLLHFLYYRVYDTDAVSLNEWILLLGIATQLRFLKIRQYAIREISAQRSALSPVETIVLATTHDVPEWLAPAFADMSRRPHPLDDLEAEQLGAQITARIGRAREALRDETFRTFQRKRYGNRYAVPDSFDDEVVSRVVMEVFWPGAAPVEGP
ncbi:hypothetical protein B0H21DRAFT_437818 [Amylocystis lapponica]|nr:hypothetical protein B0H21DRAFT_437818 [Amylocystis lapponica]